MNNINDIYTINHRNHAEFRGTLRNQRKFEYGQTVFIGSGYDKSITLYPAIITGIRDDKDYLNPAFIYEVQVPRWVVKRETEELNDAYNVQLSEIPSWKLRLRYRVKKYHRQWRKEQSGRIEYRSLRCDRIFTSVEQAKESILENHKIMTELEREHIDGYFKKFDKNTELK